MEVRKCNTQLMGSLYNCKCRAYSVSGATRFITSTEDTFKQVVKFCYKQFTCLPTFQQVVDLVVDVLKGTPHVHATEVELLGLYRRMRTGATRDTVRDAMRELITHVVSMRCSVERLALMVIMRNAGGFHQNHIDWEEAAHYLHEDLFPGASWHRVRCSYGASTKIRVEARWMLRTAKAGFRHFRLMQKEERQCQDATQKGIVHWIRGKVTSAFNKRLLNKGNFVDFIQFARERAYWHLEKGFSHFRLMLRQERPKAAYKERKFKVTSGYWTALKQPDGHSKASGESANQGSEPMPKKRRFKSFNAYEAGDKSQNRPAQLCAAQQGSKKIRKSRAVWIDDLSRTFYVSPELVSARKGVLPLQYAEIKHLLDPSDPIEWITTCEGQTIGILQWDKEAFLQVTAERVHGAGNGLFVNDAELLYGIQNNTVPFLKQTVVPEPTPLHNIYGVKADSNAYGPWRTHLVVPKNPNKPQGAFIANSSAPACYKKGDASVRKDTTAKRCCVTVEIEGSGGHKLFAWGWVLVLTKTPYELCQKHKQICHYYPNWGKLARRLLESNNDKVQER